MPVGSPKKIQTTHPLVGRPRGTTLNMATRWKRSSLWQSIRVEVWRSSFQDSSRQSLPSALLVRPLGYRPRGSSANTREGTSVTFSYVLTNNAPAPGPGPTSSFIDPNVQFFLAISWLLFLLSLAFACLGSTLLTFFRAHWEKDWDGQRGRRSQAEVQMYAVLVSGLLGSLIIAAFIFLCLVVRSFTPVVGWIALGFTCWFGLIILSSVLWQVPWRWRGLD